MIRPRRLPSKRSYFALSPPTAELPNHSSLALTLIISSSFHFCLLSSRAGNQFIVGGWLVERKKQKSEKTRNPVERLCWRLLSRRARRIGKRSEEENKQKQHQEMKLRRTKRGGGRRRMMLSPRMLLESCPAWRCRTPRGWR